MCTKTSSTQEYAGSIPIHLQQKYVKEQKEMCKNGWDPEGSTTAYGTVILVIKHRKLIEKCDKKAKPLTNLR